jgi:Fur family ferric uptake transcriptional regulator
MCGQNGGMMGMQSGSVEAMLSEKHLKITKARKLILELLTQLSPKTVDELDSLLTQKGEKLSLSTIYRTCETLSANGLLMKTNLTDDGIARYEFLKGGHMHHAICLGCGCIIPIDDCPFGQFDRLMQTKYDFEVASHRIEIYGYCKECRKRHP